MANPAYLFIDSDPVTTQGALSEESVGGLAQANHEDESLIIAFEHGLIMPTDPMSGAPQGNRRHEDLIITKVFDRVTPLFYQALCEGIRFDAEIRWYRIAKDGTNEHYFTMALTEAAVVNMRPEKLNTMIAANENMGDLERVHIRYNAIEWRHEVASISHVDSWQSAE